MRTIPAFLAAVLAGAAIAGASPMDDPFGYFNVYSLGDIGSIQSPYGSDFQGVAGAAGNVCFSSFSLHGNDSTTGYSLHTGGSARLTGAYSRSLEIGQDAQLGHLSVGGNLVAGGNVTNFGGGTIAGNVIAEGDILLSGSMTVNGQRQSGVPFDPIAHHAPISQYFGRTSSEIGLMAPTGVVTETWGQLSFAGASGVNVVSIDAARLRSAWGFTITAPEDATVFINVPDGAVDLDSTNWVYGGGISRDSVLLNMPNATDLDLSGANTVNILAPLADTCFPKGLITGSLIVGQLRGGGQVNLGHFTRGGPVPEPVTLTLLVLSLPVVIRHRRRQAA